MEENILCDSGMGDEGEKQVEGVRTWIARYTLQAMIRTLFKDFFGRYSGGLTPRALLLFFLARVFYMRTINDDKQCASISEHLVHKGFCSRTKSGRIKMPEPGLHFSWPARALFFLDDDGEYRCLRYSVFSLFSEARFESMFDGFEKSGVTVRTDKRERVVKSKEVTPRPWQKEVMRIVLDEFKEKQHAAILIVGTSGAGKTTLGMLLAEDMRTETRDPVVVSNHTLKQATQGVSFSPANKPSIIVWNEFNEIAKRDSATKNISEPEICNYLDTLGEAENVILIATFNGKISDIPFVYTRRGRFSHHCVVSMRDGQPEVVITEAPEFAPE